MPDLRIAVLIDADNSSHHRIEAVLAEVATQGNAHVRRAYGDWTSQNMSGWTKRLQENAIVPIQRFAFTKGKNASDMALVVDAMDLLHRGEADGFAIVSSDADFTPLVERLKQSGSLVIGFGEQKTPAPFVNACSQFLYLDSLGADEDSEDTEEAVRPSPQRKSGAELKSDTRLMRMLYAAVDFASDDDGWADLAAIGNQIANQSSFQSRNFGYARWSGLIEEIDKFETRRIGNHMKVRRRGNKR